MVTARELVVLSGSFTSHSKSVRGLSHLRGHASHERYTASTVQRREINLHKFCPSGNRTPGRRLGRRTPLPARLLRHFSLFYSVLLLKLEICTSVKGYIVMPSPSSQVRVSAHGFRDHVPRRWLVRMAKSFLFKEKQNCHDRKSP